MRRKDKDLTVYRSDGHSGEIYIPTERIEQYDQLCNQLEDFLRKNFRRPIEAIVFLHAALARFEDAYGKVAIHEIYQPERPQ
jgi:hypothetical protein